MIAAEKRSVVRVAAPMAALTAVGMLATDLYLPAVPSLPNLLGGTVAQSQLTLASFMGALSLSQILWGWASDRHGEEKTLKIGMALLLMASVLCALSRKMEVLIFGRAIQGLGAGAATAVVPALLKKSFGEADAVRSIAVVGMAESLAPALGPILGAGLISLWDWRASFWIVAGMTALLIPWVTRVTHFVSGQELNRESLIVNLRTLLRERSFLRYSWSYSLLFSALLLFVASAPQLITHTLGLSVQFFSLLQLFGVGAFILGASQGGRLVERFGTSRVLSVGAVLQIAAGVVFGVLSGVPAPVFAGLVVGWCLFCCGLGLRAPLIFARALSFAGSRAGQASGLLMFLAFGLSSAVTALVAPFLHLGLMPVAVVQMGLILASVWLTRES